MYLKTGDTVPGDFNDTESSESNEASSAVSVYRVTEVVAETPWCGLYRGKKVFQNFIFKTRQYEETEEHDCLDVLLKTVAYPQLHDISNVVYSRNHAKFELSSVLACPDTDQIPEPIDLVLIRNTRDGFEFQHTEEFVDREPVLVFENICGDPLGTWVNSGRHNVRAAMRIAGELFTLTSHLHANGMLLNLLHPGSIWIDGSNRSHFVGTENVVSVKKSDTIQSLFPPNRYPQLFAAPELLTGTATPTVSTDMLAIASIVWFLLTKRSPFGGGHGSGAETLLKRRPDPNQVQSLRTALASLSAQARRDIEGWLEVSGTKFEKKWPDGFVNGLLACLDPDANQRPVGVDDLRRIWRTAPPFPVREVIGIQEASGKLKICFSASLGAQFLHDPRKPAPRVTWQTPIVRECSSTKKTDTLQTHLRMGKKSGVAIRIF
ncbi:MAG: hypothetical protein WKF77_09495 [Planctomycetaceae bacterium]